MSQVSRAFQCPNCGAQLHPTGREATITCEFCGATSPLAALPAERVEAPRSSEGTSTFFPWSRVALVVIPVGAAVAWLALRTGAPAPASKSVTTSVVAAPDAAAASAPKTVTEWHLPPILADVNGDGVEDIVGQWDQDRQCVTGLIDGKTRRVAWSIAHAMNCGWSQPFALVSSTLVLAPGKKPSLELYALPAGTDVGRVDLDHEPSLLLGHGQEVWIDMSGSEALLDTTTKTVTPAWGPKRPSWLHHDIENGLLPPGHYEPDVRCSPSPCSDANLRRPVPPIPNMRTWQVLIDDGVDAAVAVGDTARGTQLPMVAGFSVASKTVAWTHAFGTPETAVQYGATSAVIAQNTLYIQYATKDPAKPDSNARSRLAALSATTGELLWDVAIDDDRGRAFGGGGSNWPGERIVVGAWVYVPLAHSLELRDPKSGALVAQLP